MNSLESAKIALVPVLNEYEARIEDLTKEVVFYTKQQENLRNEITTLIHENKALSQFINQLLEQQSNHKCEVYGNKPLENELVQNLKAQLCLAQKEKDTAIELWQAALKNLDHLEGTLDLYEGRTHGYFSRSQVAKMKMMYDNKIMQLKEHLQQYQTDLDNCKKSLDSKNVELKNLMENKASTYSLATRLENEVRQLDNRLGEIINMRDELQTNLEMKNQIIIELQTKDMEAKRKVSEALQLVEAACFEKDAALARENEAKQEVLKISKTLSEIIDETAEKIKTDAENIKQGYNNRLKNLQGDILKLQKALKEKEIELTKCLQECRCLNEELDKLRKGHVCVEESHTSKLLILEKNLESTFQKLLLSEKKNLQLEAEKESIKLDLEQMANCYKSDIKTRETEKEVMKRQLKTLKVQLRASNTNVLEAVTKADKLKAQLQHLDAVIQEKLKLQQIMHEQALSKSIEGIQYNSSKIQSELQHHIKLQRGLNKKIKKEMIEIINEMENRMEELKKAKKLLEQNLKTVVKDNSYYKENLKYFCTGVMNLSEITSDVSVK